MRTNTPTSCVRFDRRRAAAIVSISALVSAALAGCVPRRSGVGAECEINSECATPLVCRLGHCRLECVTSADCAAGLACVLDAQRIGSCQLEAETSCTLTSDCEAPLVCRFAQCTNACETDRDCPGGSRCERGPDGAACIDRSVTPCALDGDCDVLGASGMPSRCVRGRCRAECRTDRDCRNEFWCDDGTGSCLPLPRFARPDSGADAVSSPGADAPSDRDAPPPLECTTPMPFPLAWTLTLAGIGAGDARAVIVGRRMVVVDPTDFVAGPGGNVYTLDLDAHVAFTTTPFAEARKDMELGTDGARLLVTGGILNAGPPLRDLYEIDPSTGSTMPLGYMDAEARYQSSIVACGGHVVRAGGDPQSAEFASRTIDVFDLGVPGSSTTSTLASPTRSLAVAASATHAYILGGITHRGDMIPYASNRLVVLDCAAGTTREAVLPTYYGGTPTLFSEQATFAAVDGDRLIISGLHYRDDTTRLDAMAARPTYESIDVMDLVSERWESLPVPAVLQRTTARRPAFAYVAGRLFRSDFSDVAMLDIASGAWRCFTEGGAGGTAQLQLLSDGAVLYTLVYVGADLRVNAYVLP